MFIRPAGAIALCASWLAFAPPAFAQSPAPLTLARALQRAIAINPRVAAAERDIAMAAGRRIQAGARPNPELSGELDNAAGSGAHRGLRSAETTLQISQLIELGGKREARIAAGAAEFDAAKWQSAATRLELLTETAVAFYSVLSGQRRVQIYDTHIASLDRLTPLLQRRIDAGASSPGEIARVRVAADLVRAERERARTSLAVARRELAVLMGLSSPDFSFVAGELNRVGQPPAFNVIVRALDDNPQLIRWTAVRAQRDAELLSARLKPIPDLRLSAGWRHYRDTNDNAVRVGVSVPIPLFDRNQGAILEAHAARDKVDAEHGINKGVLLLTLGKAYETVLGALRESEVLRGSALPNARQAVEAVESGYGQGRFSLLELLDAQATSAQAALRLEEALMSFHTGVVTIEGLIGVPFTLGGARRK